MSMPLLNSDFDFCVSWEVLFDCQCIFEHMSLSFSLEHYYMQPRVLEVEVKLLWSNLLILVDTKGL